MKFDKIEFSKISNDEKLTAIRQSLKSYTSDRIPSNFTSSKDLENYTADMIRETVNNLVYLDGKPSNGVDNLKFQQNKNLVFAIIGEMLKELTPRKVMESFGRFAMSKKFAPKDKPRFKIKKGRQNVKRYVTKVAPGGVYNRVTASSDYVDVDIEAIGGAVYVRIEDFLSGEVELGELVDLLLEGMEDEMYRDVQNALKSTFDSLPANNKATGASFVKEDFDNIITTVKAYGNPNIVCTEAFAKTILPSADYISDSQKETIGSNGYLLNYEGTPVIVMPNSFETVENETKIIDDQYCYIVPSGASNEIIAIAMEGDTMFRNIQREDWSEEMQAYMKYGVSVLHTNFFGIYRNTSL